MAKIEKLREAAIDCLKRIEPYNLGPVIRFIKELSLEAELRLEAEEECKKEKDPNWIRTTELIRRFSIPENIKGYEYLKKALMLTICMDDTYIEGLIEYLHYKIAKELNATALEVEEEIHHAIEISYERDSGEAKKIFDKNPTNGEFIARLTEILRMEDNR